MPGNCSRLEWEGIYSNVIWEIQTPHPTKHPSAIIPPAIVRVKRVAEYRGVNSTKIGDISCDVYGFGRIHDTTGSKAGSAGFTLIQSFYVRHTVEPQPNLGNLQDKFTTWLAPSKNVFHPGAVTNFDAGVLELFGSWASGKLEALPYYWYGEPCGDYCTQYYTYWVHTDIDPESIEMIWGRLIKFLSVAIPNYDASDVSVLWQEDVVGVLRSQDFNSATGSHPPGVRIDIRGLRTFVDDTPVDDEFLYGYWYLDLENILKADDVYLIYFDLYGVVKPLHSDDVLFDFTGYDMVDGVFVAINRIPLYESGYATLYIWDTSTRKRRIMKYDSAVVQPFVGVAVCYDRSGDAFSRFVVACVECGYTSSTIAFLPVYAKSENDMVVSVPLATAVVEDWLFDIGGAVGGAFVTTTPPDVYDIVDMKLYYYTLNDSAEVEMQHVLTEDWYDGSGKLLATSGEQLYYGLLNNAWLGDFYGGP